MVSPVKADSKKKLVPAYRQHSYSTILEKGKHFQREEERKEKKGDLPTCKSGEGLLYN